MKILQSFSNILIFEKRKTPLTIYALKETIDILKNHSFNDLVWPDFTKIKLQGTQEDSLIFKEIQIDEVININDYKIKAIPEVTTPPGVLYGRGISGCLILNKM